MNFGSFFICLPKALVKVSSFETAYFYVFLLDYSKRSNDWFVLTVSDAEVETGLSKYVQRKSVDRLIELGLIEYKIVGMDRFRSFRILKCIC